MQSGDANKAKDAREVLDALTAAEAHEREAQAAAVAALGNVERVVQAFTKLPLSKSDEKAVQVLLDNPGLTSEALTLKAGWKAQAWHLRFGLMCSARAHLLWPAPFEASRGADFFCEILTDFDETTRGYNFKSEALEGFARLGLKPRGSA